MMLSLKNARTRTVMKMRAVKDRGERAGPGRYVLRASDGGLIHVSEEVYKAYYKMRRRERYQEEQKKKKGVISLDVAGYNTNSLSKGQAGGSEIEDAMMKKWHLKILYEELDRLVPWDKRMVGLLYFSGLTLKETAAVLGCSRGKVIAHRDKALSKIRARFHREGVLQCPV